MELVVADYSNQALTAVPDTVFDNKYVGILDLSSNNISQIGHSISQLPYLHELHADVISLRCKNPNDYDNLSKNMAKLNHLKKMSTWRNPAASSRSRFFPGFKGTSTFSNASRFFAISSFE